MRFESEAPGIAMEMAAPGVALLTIDRPPANSLSLELRKRLAEIWAEVRDDAAISAVVVTGSGNRYFSAGLDMYELAEWHETRSPEERHHLIDLLSWDPWRANLQKPVIGAINGFCLAGGMYLAIMCDVRIASTTAQFGIPEVKWGHPAAFTWMLAREMPVNLALEMTLWGDRTYPASRMYEVGFLNGIVDQSDLLDTALEWASAVARMPLAALASHKRILYQSVFDDFERAQLAAEESASSLHALPDSTERLAHFFRDRKMNGDS